MGFFKNASKKREKEEKLAVSDPERARRVSIQCRKELLWSPKTGKIYDFDEVPVPETKN